MRHSKRRKSSDPSVARRRGESASPVPPPTAPLGPSGPRAKLDGLEFYRRHLKLSAQVDPEDVCEEVALVVEAWKAWPSSGRRSVPSQPTVQTRSAYGSKRLRTALGLGPEVGVDDLCRAAHQFVAESWQRWCESPGQPAQPPTKFVETRGRYDGM